MKKIRIGKDITVKWTILTNGEAVSLVDRDLSLFLYSPDYEKVPIDFIIDGNTIVFIFQGSNQKTTGIYGLTLWENYGKEGQTAVDVCSAFMLVPSTCEEEDDLQGLTAETVNLETSNLEVSLQGLSAYEIAVNEGFVGTVDEWLESLHGPSGYSPRPGDNGNWWVGNEDTGIPMQGAAGKSAFQYAVESGYEGTEASFARSLSEQMTYVTVKGTDITLDVAANRVYSCGEVRSLKLATVETGPGVSIVRFRSGAQATELTLPEKLPVAGWRIPQVGMDYAVFIQGGAATIVYYE